MSGAKFLKTDAYKRAALTYAIINGHVELVSYLLKLGAEY
jgi:ankyrin repeat protein